MLSPTSPVSDSTDVHPSEAHTEPPPSVWTGTLPTGASWTVYCGNATDVMAGLPDSSIDCMITSPPYFWLRDYGVSGQIGLEAEVKDYVQSLVDVMQHVKRLLKPTGLAFLNLGDTFYSGKGRSHGRDQKSKKRRFGLRAVDKSGGLGINLKPKSLIGIPWRVALRLLESGWILRSSVIWYRPNCLPESALDRPSRSYEHVFMLAKRRKYFFTKQPLRDNCIDQDVWMIPTHSRTNSADTAPFPESLVTKCLAIGCAEDGVVLDPFLGSGTTAKVAISTGRSAIGIDLNRKFCEISAHSLQNLQ